MKTRRARVCLSLLLTLVMVLSIFTGTAASAFAAEDQVETTVATTAAPAEEEQEVAVENTAPTAEESEREEESEAEEESPAEESVEEAPAQEISSNKADEADTDTFEEVEVEVAETETDSTQDQPLMSSVSHNLADHIKTLEIVGNPDSVEGGTNLTVKFGWLIDGEVHGGTDTFEYQLPVNFAIDHASTGPITKGERGETIGSYRVDTNGKVTISYNSNYNTSNQTTINYMEVTGKAEYKPTDSDHNIIFTWKDGSKVVVVTNAGDFSIAKSNKIIWPNDKLSSNATVRYTVKISSEQGTNDAFTVTDKLTLSEPIGRGTTFKSVDYDPNSFEIVDDEGKTVNGWSVDVNSRDFTITDLPKLGAGKSYTLTYDVAVVRATRTDTAYASRDGNIQNTVTATSDGDKATANSTARFSGILGKYINGLDETRGRGWQIRVFANGTDLTGYVIKDVSQHPITDRVQMQAYDASGNWLQTITYESDFAGKTEFEITIPHGEVNGRKVNEWRIYYYTNGEVEAGQTAATTNATYLIGNGEEWEVHLNSTIGVGNQTLSTPTKRYLENSVNPDNAGYLDFYWNFEVNYRSLSSKSVKFSDLILAPSRRGTDVWGNVGANDSVLPNGHFGIASVLQSDLTDGTNGLHLVLSDDSELTYNQAIAAGYKITIKYYTSTASNVTTTIDSADSTTHVRRFEIEVVAPEGQEKLDVKKIYVNRYHTTFDTSAMTPGFTWRINNRLTADGATSNSYGETSRTLGSISKQVRIARSKNADGTQSNVTYFDGAVTADYDLQNGQLGYRLLVTVPEGQTSVTVTDLIPAGLTLADNAGSGIAWDDNLKVGLYSTTNGTLKSDNNGHGNSTWTDARRSANISVTQQAEGDATRLTVTVNNLDSQLTFRRGSRIIAIDYVVSMPKDLGVDGETVEEGDGFVATKTYHNTAEFDGSTASVDTTVKQSQNVLNKTGEQILNNGAYTNRVHYVVKINPNAQDLLEGSDDLTLTDTMTSDALDFKLDPTSVKLYDANGVEVEIPGVDVQQPETVDGTTTQIFTITVKDATAYTLEYDFIADRLESASAATRGDFVNEIALKGSVNDTDTTEVRGINVRATSNHAGLTLAKVDENNNTKFLSAQFKLEKYNGTDYEFVQNITVSGQNGFNFDYYAENCKLEGNTLYRIVETTAPEGYELDETPFYFIIKGNIQDVRSGSIAMTELVIASEAEAKTAAKAPAGIEIHMLEPDTGNYFEIKNARIPAGGKIVLEANKELTGRDLKAGEFSFIVTEDGETVATGTNDADGKITFSEISYTMDDLGEHTYEVSENSGKLGGVTYDSENYEVKVTVTDVETAVLSVEAQYPAGGIVFENKYNASGAVKLEASKTLSGRELKAGEFTFSVKEDDKVVATGTNDADGKIEFSQIDYNQDETGTHTYTITEDPGNLSGVTYDTNSFTVTVEVTDSGSGKLVAVPAYPSDGVEFKNSYDVDATSVNLEATKTLTGRDLEAGEFNFTVTEDGETVATGTNNASGKVTFSTLNYELSDVGTHTLTVTEDAGQLGGVTYSDASFEVTVEVTDNGDGTLSTVVKYPDGGVVFENSYAAEGEVALEATKTLTGREMQDGEFSFTVTEDDEIVAAGKNDADGNIAFDTIQYTLADIGTHTYIITEDAGQLGGVTYSEASFEVTVTVTDNGDGTLSADAVYPEGGVKFENTYDVDKTSVILDASKDLTGRDLNDGEFSFTVTENGNTVATGTNDAEGKIVFSEIEYALSDVGTHTYVVTEDAGQLGGVTYSDASFEVTVTVTDNGDGTLSVQKTMEVEEIVFENSYAAEGEVALEATKTLTGRELQDGEFSFTVTEDDEIVAAGTNDADGNIAFDTIQYTLDDIGTHTYIITEDAGQLGGVTYSEASIEVTVEVTDNGDGTLSTEVTYPEDGATFENTYDVAPEKLTLEASKELTGRDLKDGEFSFTITEDGETVATGTNDTEGKVVFSEIEYKLADVGTHTYVVTEDAGDKGGVDYSNESYTVTVTVTDNGDGTLDVQTAMPESGIVFHNSYGAAEAVVSLGAKKTLSGAALKDGQFSFTLKDANGKVVETVNNKADGSIAFAELRFTEAGVYSYTISEVAGNDKQVTYDTTVYNVKITVVDNEEGKLIATVDTEGKTLQFKNKYTPEEPKKPTIPSTPKKTKKTSGSPKTGDNSNTMIWISLLLVAIAAAVVVVSKRMRDVDK